MTHDQLQTAITMRAQGESYNAIAAATELNKGTIFHKLEKDEINQLIKKAQTDLIKNSLTTAIQNQTNKIKSGARIAGDIDAGKDLSPGSVKLLELAHDAEGKLLQSVGIHPSHTQSIQINNILVDARSELSPAVEALLVNHITGKDVIDV
jgi:hypothetical protein